MFMEPGSHVKNVVSILRASLLATVMSLASIVKFNQTATASTTTRSLAQMLMVRTSSRSKRRTRSRRRTRRERRGTRRVTRRTRRGRRRRTSSSFWLRRSWD